MYHGIDRCDRCGKRLREREWLSGICRQCEAKERVGKGEARAEALKARKDLGDG